ncbi:MAG: glycosyltransferase family 2 protein [Cyanobacteriota bacterium]|nr:glycosyltransferase family 2 protein [Cyanobacteriota bacterium]
MTQSDVRPLVSVVVPNYNHALFLPERLRSIRSQTVQDFELIVLDDASSDDSLDVIRRELQGYPHRLLVNSENSGSPCSQWLKGIKEARGRYIWLAESDDSCADNFLEALLDPLEQGACIAYCRAAHVDVDGEAVSALEYWPDRFDRGRWRSAFQLDASDFNRRYMRLANCIPNASAVIFRRDRALGMIRLSDLLRRKIFTGDWIFWTAFLADGPGRLAFDPRELCRFRWHAQATRAAGSREREARRFREYSEAVDYVLTQSGERKLLRWIPIAMLGGWDWILTEYLVRYQPGLWERFRARGLHGRLALASYVRLASSRQMRRFYRHPRPVELIYP